MKEWHSYRGTIGIYMILSCCSRMLPLVLDVARMTFDDFLSQAVIFDVAVDFGRSDTFVSQHGLDNP